MSQWPMVSLGDVLTHRKAFIEINDLEPYKRCRVQLHARGKAGVRGDGINVDIVQRLVKCAANRRNSSRRNSRRNSRHPTINPGRRVTGASSRKPRADSRREMRTRRASGGSPRQTRHDHARREGKNWTVSRDGSRRGIRKTRGGRSGYRRTNACRRERRRIEPS